MSLKAYGVGHTSHARSVGLGLGLRKPIVASAAPGAPAAPEKPRRDSNGGEQRGRRPSWGRSSRDDQQAGGERRGGRQSWDRSSQGNQQAGGERRDSRPRTTGSRGGGQRSRPAAGAGGSGGSGWCDVATAPVWRIFNVSVPAESDPGKDDYEVHPQLLAALSKKVGVREAAADDSDGGRGGQQRRGPRSVVQRPIPPSAVRIVRKSFDARNSTKGADAARKSWVYCLDVESADLLAAGVRRLQERTGVMERQDQSQQAPAATGAVLVELPQKKRQRGGSAGTVSSSSGSEAANEAPDASSGGAGNGSSRSGGAAEPVVVVGSGPAGLFAALQLAEAGIKVVLLERGQPVEVRGKDIGALFVRRQVNPESNLCYGEGGAGTWSDGKLTTRIGRNSDPVRQVLHTLYRFGAPESVLVSGKPHLGTDRLVKILKGFREYLIGLGCEVRFGAKVADLEVKAGKVAGVRLEDGSTIAASHVVLAVGHSARELYRKLQACDVAITPKPFAMGFRIEHPQEVINQLQYGEEDAAQVLRGKGRYPVAEYRLAAEISAAAAAQAAADAVGAAADGSAFTDDWYQPLLAAATAAGEGGSSGSGSSAAGEEAAGAEAAADPSAGRGVYSFCMCPGGQIVPTSTSEDLLCINGMSFSRRNSKWANSALVVAVQPSDWQHLEAAHGSLAGVALQEQYEREAALRGGGAFVAPAQRVTDFLAGQAPKGALPTSSYRLGVKAAPLHDFYPPHMTAAFVAALARFDRQLPGFVSDQALLHAAETRTSAPLRIDRAPDSLQSVILPGLYPCGEGAGYAGGIVSSAVDGLRVGSTIAAELTGRAGALNAAAFKVKGGY